MEILSCLLEIQHRFDSLTPTEKRIARYIAENSSRVPMMPIDELAELILRNEVTPITLGDVIADQLAQESMFSAS